MKAYDNIASPLRANNKNIPDDEIDQKVSTGSSTSLESATKERLGTETAKSTPYRSSIDPR